MSGLLKNWACVPRSPNAGRGRLYSCSAGNSLGFRRMVLHSIEECSLLRVSSWGVGPGRALAEAEPIPRGCSGWISPEGLPRRNELGRHWEYRIENLRMRGGTHRRGQQNGLIEVNLMVDNWDGMDFPPV